MKKLSLLTAIPFLAVASFAVSACGNDTGGGGGGGPVEYFHGEYQNQMIVLTNTGSVYRGETPDPTVIRDPDTGTFYAYATPGITLRSDDGCQWTVHRQKEFTPNKALWTKLSDEEKEKDYIIWAPDVICLEGTWIYYYSYACFGGAAGIGYAIGDSPAGPFVDQGPFIYTKEIGIDNCIDSQVIVDLDGSVYMVAGSFCGCYIFQLEPDGLSPLGGVAKQRDEKILIGGTGPGFDLSKYEGSYIIFNENDDMYYYFGSVSDCCQHKDSNYHVVVGRSESITGPYVDSKGKPMTLSAGGNTIGEMVVWGGTSKDLYAGPGHHSIFVDDAGDWWIYYHSYDKSDNFSQRHLFLDKLEWDDNGFPYVDGNSKFQPSYGTTLPGPRLL